MSDGRYYQFCPVSMAAEIVCSRWTLLVLRELMMGTTRFNDLRRGLARMSPALLSKRLKELEAAGLVRREEINGERGVFDYRLTASGEELKPIIVAVGIWGHKWIETETSLKNLDPQLLMWDIRRNINTEPMPNRRSVVQFIFPELPQEQRNWWLIIQPGQVVDLCLLDPGFDVDLYVSTDLRTLTQVWMGYVELAKAKQQSKLILTGSKALQDSLQTWFSLSTFARMERLAA